MTTSYIQGTPPSQLVSISSPITAVHSAAVDTFFDEVFGDSGLSSISSDSINTPDATVTPTKTTPSLQINTRTTDTSKYAEQLQSRISTEDIVRVEVESPFPDVPRMTTSLLKLGYVPDSLRGKVWCLSLTGVCTEDQEAIDFVANNNELGQHHSAIKADIDSFILRSSKNSMAASPFPPESMEEIRKNLNDIIVLYCMRKSKEYHQIYTSIMAPLFISNNSIMSKGLAFSCFHSLCSGFIPLINLPVELCYYSALFDNLNSISIFKIILCPGVISLNKM